MKTYRVVCQYQNSQLLPEESKDVEVFNRLSFAEAYLIDQAERLGEAEPVTHWGRSAGTATLISVRLEERTRNDKTSPWDVKVLNVLEW